jgi:CRISPR system Cascade subunit CasE
MLTGQKRCEHTISVFSVLYDGILEVSEAALFNKGIKEGIGHAKSLGLGLLSIVPVR